MKDKAIVDEIHVKDNDLAMPILLKFQNGTLLTNRKEHTLFTKLKDKHNNKTALVLADDQVYEGVIKDNDELTDLYICVRNKTTNKCRILPIEQVQLHNHIFKQLDQEERQQISRDDKYKTLLSQFGGRKAVRYMNSQQQMKMDIDLMKENLDQTVQDNKTALDESTTDGGVLDDQKYLDSIRVKFNADAKHLHEVYNVKDAIPEELLDRLEEEANMVMSCNVEDVPIQSIYLREELKLALNAEKPVDEIKLKIKMIIYMDALKNLLRSRERYMKKIKMSDVTEKVENDIRNRFVDSTVKRCMRSGFTTEKALCHFIVLALMLSDKFEVPMQTLQEELTTVRAKIIRYGHVVCALPKENGTMLTLRLPKNVKPLSTSFGRKKRKTI